MTKHDLAKEIEKLADRIRTDAEEATKAEAGVSVDFVRFEDDDLPEIPDDWTWEEREKSWGIGGTCMVAVRDDDAEVSE